MGCGGFHGFDELGEVSTAISNEPVEFFCQFDVLVQSSCVLSSLKQLESNNINNNVCLTTLTSII